MASQPRGIRNNNPGNIERNATRWAGMTAEQTDPRFVVFTSPEYGFRALARTLLTYQRKYGLLSIEDMIGRWAPPNENDTGAYVAAVASAVGVEPDAPIDLANCTRLFVRLLRAICVHENGMCPYSEAVIDHGLALAGVRR